MQYGYTAKAAAEPVGPKFLRITDIQNGTVDWKTVPHCPIDGAGLGRFLLQPGDIVFARTGATTGKSFLISSSPEAVFASYLIRLRPATDIIEPAYLAYYFKTQAYWDHIAVGTTGSAQGGFNASKLAALPVPVPPLEEQKRIVAILDEAFEGLARARENAEANLKNARELLVSGIREIFNDIEMHCERRNVGEVAEHVLGKMLDKTKNKGELRPYLRNINVRWFTIDSENLLTMKVQEYEIERYSVRKGDLLICEGGYPGRAAIWEGDDAICFQKALHRVRFAEPIYNRLLMYYLFLQVSSGALRAEFTGTGIQHLTGQSLSKLSFPMPPVRVAKSAVRRIEEVYRHVQRLNNPQDKKARSLEEFAQSLLRKAFSGQLT
ncbi:MAG: restriction endonuclease subunit S [Pseudomonadota bacterium]